MRMKVLEWNINGASALTWNRPYTIKRALVDKVMDQKADIIILVEFCIASGWDYFEERLHKAGYVFFMSCLTGKNGILICIRSDLIKKVKSDKRNKNPLAKDSLADRVYDDFKRVVSYSLEDHNSLSVSFEMKDGRKATVIGCRIEVDIVGKDKKDLKKEFDHRALAFERFMEEMLIREQGKALSKKAQSDICIVAGDFNNARCLGDLNKEYDSADYDGKAHINYNLNIIKDRFESTGFTMLDIGTGWGIPTFSRGKTNEKYFPEDHIFVRGFAPGDRFCKAIVDDDLSDHAIVLAEFSADTDAK